MAINVKLSEDFVADARRNAQAEHRSLPKQIEYYYRIGKIAEDNPDLSYKLIREILKAMSEGSAGEYKFGDANSKEQIVPSKVKEIKSATKK